MWPPVKAGLATPADTAAGNVPIARSLVERMKKMSGLDSYRPVELQSLLKDWLTSQSEFGGGFQPEDLQKTLKTEGSILRLQSGEIAVLAGLMQDFAQQQDSGLPGVRSIPLLGEALSNRSDLSAKTELVIFLRATVIRDPSIEGDFRAYRDQVPRDDFFSRPSRELPRRKAGARQEM